jgi:hypothetical protein
MGLGYVYAMRLLLPFLIAAVVRAAAAADVVDQQTAATYEQLLAPEVLAHYKAGEYRNEIAAWPANPPWEQAFADASAANVKRLGVNDAGTIVGQPGGAPATGIYGLPFRIDPADPQAGVKVIWNAYYALWRIGSTHDVLTLDWVGKKGLERQALLESHTLYSEGVPAARAQKGDTLGLASRQLAVVTSPADLNGTASLTWRFRAADQRDQSWTYVPALRRVRQVSPANRSDGFLGSDLSQDDGAFFDGKPEDFTWKLVGEREALVLADPASLAGTVSRKGRPDGGFEEQWAADQKILGYQDREWTGLPWAPRGPVLARRQLWIVEATPHDPYYLFKKIELGIDKETFQGARSRKFDGQGALLRSIQFLGYAAWPIEVGSERLVMPASSMGLVLAENTKQGRATAAGSNPPGNSVHERRVPIDPALFQLDRLSAGK